MSRYKSHFQWSRALDVAVSVVVLSILSPLLLTVAIIIRLGMGAPVLFSQARTGFHGKSFQFYKFRTMRNINDANGRGLPDSERLTPLGRLLRSWSVDEIPGFVNVLKGDISLVGPRPLLPKYMSRYTPRQLRRHEVKPGLTGWAQVNGRNAISWEERLALDVWYVDNKSIWLDLKIIAITLLKVLRREGISADGEATMPEFFGTEEHGDD